MICIFAYFKLLFILSFVWVYIHFNLVSYFSLILRDFFNSSLHFCKWGLWPCLFILLTLFCQLYFLIYVLLLVLFVMVVIFDIRSSWLWWIWCFYFLAEGGLSLVLFVADWRSFLCFNFISLIFSIFIPYRVFSLCINGQSKTFDLGPGKVSLPMLCTSLLVNCL